MLMDVPGRMLYPRYDNSSFGAMRALRPVRPKARRLASLMHAEK